jgi:AraC-like DNA-binding protein
MSPSPRLAELVGLIDRLGDRDGRHPGWLPGLTLSRASAVTEPLSDITRPVLALIAQGAKRTVLADQIYDYRAGQYLIATVDLPLTAQVTEAPFLALGLPLKQHLIAELLLESSSGARDEPDDSGVLVSDASGDLVDAVVRLLRLAEHPEDFAVLAPAAEREIHWRLMNGPHAATVRRIGLPGSRVALVGQAVRWLAERFDQPIRIADLAAHVGVSVPTLNRHFRAVTAMSPLQYQKQLRLQRARVELLAAPGDVAAAGYAVGYDSPSQFSREYRRQFGAPPGQDAARLLTASPRLDLTSRGPSTEEERGW